MPNNSTNSTTNKSKKYNREDIDRSTEVKVTYVLDITGTFKKLGSDIGKGVGSIKDHFAEKRRIREEFELAQEREYTKLREEKLKREREEAQARVEEDYSLRDDSEGAILHTLFIIVCLMIFMYILVMVLGY